MVYTPDVASSTLQPLLARAQAALDRGHGTEAVQLLAPALRSAALTREDELALRSLLAEAWLLHDELEQASLILGRTPDTMRETISAGRVSTLWRLHGRLASARGDQSRAIAMHGRALKQAEVSHDTRLIGLAHYELAQCYRQVGDVAIVREHITKAASALNAAGDRRHLALVHSVSGFSAAQAGRFDEAMNALRHAERLAALAGARVLRNIHNIGYGFSLKRGIIAAQLDAFASVDGSELRQNVGGDGAHGIHARWLARKYSGIRQRDS